MLLIVRKRIIFHLISFTNYLFSCLLSVPHGKRKNRLRGTLQKLVLNVDINENRKRKFTEKILILQKKFINL